MSMDVVPGQRRTKTLLGVEATYEVLAVERDHAQVQVVDAPGLAPGLRFRLDRAAVEEMDVVDVRAEVTDGLASLLRDAA